MLKLIAEVITRLVRLLKLIPNMALKLETHHISSTALDLASPAYRVTIAPRAAALQCTTADTNEYAVISPTEKSREYICNVTSYDPGEPCDGAGCTSSKSGVVNSGFKSLLNVRFGQVGEQGQICRL